MIKLFLLVYLLSLVLMTILAVVWILSALFKIEWLARRFLFLKHHNT
jgi:hypothetical protein